jgi:hypothetical protein
VRVADYLVRVPLKEAAEAAGVGPRQPDDLGSVEKINRR